MSEKKEYQYTIAYIDNNGYVFIGWNNNTDYYDVIETDCLSDEEDWCFMEQNGDGEDIAIYRCDTYEQAEEERVSAQREFDENIKIIKLVKEGAWWCPTNEDEDEDKN